MLNSQNFSPHPLLRGGSLQTLAGHYSRWKPKVIPQENIKIPPDEASNTLDIFYPRCSTNQTPNVLVLPPSHTDKAQKLALRLAAKLTHMGLRVGYGHPLWPHSPAEFFHYGSVGEVYSAMDAMHKRWPLAPLWVVGYGVAGTALLNLLGQATGLQAEFPNLKGALAACPTIDIEASYHASSSAQKRYLRGLLYPHLSRQNLRRWVLANGKKSLPLEARDPRLIAPRADGLEAYFQQCSPTYWVENIQLPTQIIVAADDPLNPYVLTTQAPFSERVDIHVEAYGGHLGFYSRAKTRFGDNHWLDSWISDWIDQMSAERTQQRPLEAIQ